MRWKYNPTKKGTNRIITRFAWIPIVLDLPIKQYVWLECYKVQQLYYDGCWRDSTKITKEYLEDCYE